VTNRLDEALKVFEGVINNQGKADALKLVKNFFLIFTKPDLLQKVIKEKNTTDIAQIMGNFAQEKIDEPIKFLETEPNKDELVEQCRQIIAHKFLNCVTDEKRKAALRERCFVVNCLQLKDVQYAMTEILKDVCFGRRDSSL
jgi:hypothetical protein